MRTSILRVVYKTGMKKSTGMFEGGDFKIKDSISTKLLLGTALGN
jgi:hypothetical protein